jgi:DNA-binding response OmpR family regulator
MSHKVLVIESDPWLSDSYRQALEGEGFSVESVSNAYSAMDIIDDNQPAAIIMSLLLSGGASIALLHELQTYEDTATIPVIVCSGSDTFNAEYLEPYGVSKVIDSRAMQPKDLSAAVRSALS